MNPYLRMAHAVTRGVLIGLSLAFVISHMPWRWMQFATIFALLGATFVWNVRELRWVRRQQREMAEEYARFMAMVDDER